MNKYNRKSPRWDMFDYSSEWTFYITICTKDREQYFGYMINWIICLSELWSVCYNEIIKTCIIRESVEIHELIVMPNHVHFIIGIKNECVGTHWYASFKDLRDVKGKGLHSKKDMQQHVPTQTLWSVIANIKWSVTRYVNKKWIPFAWQSRYHDRIIRNQKEYEAIKYYIQENPRKRSN